MTEVDQTDTPAPEQDDDKPIQAPMHVAPPQDPRIKEVWQDYLQKCCEVGQIDFQLAQIDSQKRQMEKNLDVAKRMARNAAKKHREIQQEILSEAKPAKAGH